MTYVISFIQMHKICFALGEHSVSLICRIIYHDFNKLKILTSEAVERISVKYAVKILHTFPYSETS